MPEFPGKGEAHRLHVRLCSEMGVVLRACPVWVGASHILPMVSAVWPMQILQFNGPLGPEDCIPLSSQPAFSMTVLRTSSSSRERVLARSLKNNGQRSAQINLSMHAPPDRARACRRVVP